MLCFHVKRITVEKLKLLRDNGVIDVVLKSLLFSARRLLVFVKCKVTLNYCILALHIYFLIANNLHINPIQDR